jgi:hypothetical protein
MQSVNLSAMPCHVISIFLSAELRILTCRNVMNEKQRFRVEWTESRCCRHGKTRYALGCQLEIKLLDDASSAEER